MLLPLNFLFLAVIKDLVIPTDITDVSAGAVSGGRVTPRTSDHSRPDVSDNKVSSQDARQVSSFYRIDLGTQKLAPGRSVR